MDTVDTLALDSRNITLEQLRAFVLIAQEDGGFNHAAQILNRSQSAITQSLQRLEMMLGCRLIERERGHIIGLTADGQRLMPAAVDILRRTAEALSAMRHPAVTGRLRIGVPDDFSVIELQTAIARFGKFNRHLQLEIISTESSLLLNKLAENHLDLAIIHMLEPAISSLSSPHYTLTTESLHWVASRKYYLDNLENVPLVIFSHDCGYSLRAIDELQQRGKNHYCAYTSTSYQNLRAAISQNMGIGILPASILDEDLIILGTQDGFPDLGKVSLVMIENSERSEVQQIGEFLRASTGTTLKS